VFALDPPSGGFTAADAHHRRAVAQVKTAAEKTGADERK
jgi:hypothetical protein